MLLIDGRPGRNVVALTRLAAGWQVLGNYVGYPP